MGDSRCDDAEDADGADQDVVLGGRPFNTKHYIIIACDHDVSTVKELSQFEPPEQLAIRCL
jgi:hypothetical protein